MFERPVRQRCRLGVGMSRERKDVDVRTGEVGVVKAERGTFHELIDLLS